MHVHNPTCDIVWCVHDAPVAQNTDTQLQYMGYNGVACAGLLQNCCLAANKNLIAAVELHKDRGANMFRLLPAWITAC